MKWDGFFEGIHSERLEQPTARRHRFDPKDKTSDHTDGRPEFRTVDEALGVGNNLAAAELDQPPEHGERLLIADDFGRHFNPARDNHDDSQGRRESWLGITLQNVGNQKTW